MAAYTKMTDAQWALIKKLLPRQTGKGRRYEDLRRKTNGIFYVLKVGCRWRDLPRYYGDDSSVHRWFQHLIATGTIEKIFTVLLQTLDEQGKLDWSSAKLDGSFAPAKGGASKSPTVTKVRALRSIWSATVTDCHSPT